MIPEGWWHQVDSDEFTLAINYWWDGVREQLVADKRMTPYYARVMLEELIKQQCESRLEELHASAVSHIGCTLTDANSAMAAFLAANDQTKREQVLMSLRNDLFIQTQTHMATSHTKDWRELLSNASVDFVAILTQCWESDGLAPDFLNAVFRALGNDEESIKDALVAKQAHFRHLCATQMYQSMFC